MVELEAGAASCRHDCEAAAPPGRQYPRSQRYPASSLGSGDADVHGDSPSTNRAETRCVYTTFHMMGKKKKKKK